MAERPLLLFPNPESATREKRPSRVGKLHSPPHFRQGERAASIFQRLQASFNARQVELQGSPIGADPEQVLVIETVGSVANFIRAAEKIDGLEWMGEIEKEIEPDDDFYEVDKDGDKTDKLMKGCLYMVMSNQEALSRMLSLWNQYKDNPDEMNFKKGEYRGFAKFKDVFNHLKDIRRWGVQDRLAENEMLDDWRHTLAQNPNQAVRLEAELWYRRSEQKRIEGEQTISNLISGLGGEVKDRCTIPEIAYHSVLAELPAQAAQQIIDHPAVDLTKCDNIMFFRPVGQVSAGREPLDEEIAEYPTDEKNLPTGDPVVAILDGMPLENHSLLADRLQIDDPDNWASEYNQAVERQHGTAMASLIVHGDLSNNELPLSRPVYLRPIMIPNKKDFNQPREEHIPDDVLLVDFVHQAIRRIIATENPIAPTVKIINLSIGDPSRQFDRLISPLARLLDWLSLEYNVLFIISAGNHDDLIDTGLTESEFSQLSNDDIEELIVECLYGDSRHRRLLSPAESMNNITVGAIHHDSATPVSTDYFVDVFRSQLPSPISAFGGGYRRSIKPEVLYPGGRILFERPVGDVNRNIRIARRTIAPGNWVATTGTQAGQINNRRYCCGTSNSAALITRSASFCYDTLLEIFQDQAPEINLDAFVVPLLKAMVVHGCSWDEIGDRLRDILGKSISRNQLRQQISRWIGYGTSNVDMVLDCTSQRATVLGFGELLSDQAHVFNLPLPPSLGAKTQLRRFTVTLAWLSPIVPTTQKYREAHLWFEFQGGGKSREKLKAKLGTEGIDCHPDSTRRGTVQHEIFEGERAVAINDGDELKIKVNCKNDARQVKNPIRYGLMVSLEVAEAEGIDIPVYDEIRTRIAQTVEIRPQGRDQ